MQAVKIATQDPQLVSLLDGTASAGLRADALGGQFSSVPPQLPTADQVKASRIKEIEAADPFGLIDPKNRNLTLALELESLSPDRFAALEDKAMPQTTPAEERKARQMRQQAMNQQVHASHERVRQQMFQEYLAKKGRRG